MKIREMLATLTPKLREAAFRVQRWAELAAFDAAHVVELAMEERSIRGLAIGYQVDAGPLLRTYRKRVRAAAWQVRSDIENALHDGDDPNDAE